MTGSAITLDVFNGPTIIYSTLAGLLLWNIYMAGRKP